MTVLVSGHTCVLADNVKETTSTTGTGTYQLNGATSGFVGFLTAIGNGNKTLYRAQAGSSWEIGVGTVASGSPPTVARTLILKSSNSDAAVSWSAGAKDIFVVAPAALLDQIGSAAGLPGSDTITNTILANMPAWSIKLRNAGTTGDPSDAAVANITTDVVPAAGDFLLGFLSSGEIRKWEVSTITGTGIPGPDSVTNSALANMPAWSFKVRNSAGTGDPSDAALANIATDTIPAAGDFIIGFLSTGEIVKWAYSNLVPSAATTIASTKVTVFTASGSFSKDAKCIEAEIHCVGAGGGGGGAPISGAGNAAEGGGGGGGAYSFIRLADATMASSITVTIGQGGAGGGGAANGSAGTGTSFGTHCVADGAAGGLQGVVSVGSGNTHVEGSIGGEAADGTGTLRIPGGFSGGGRVISGAWVGTNYGGAAAGPWGGQVTGGATTGNGFVGRVYGGGGMGAHSQNSAAATGGAGADGICVVIERLSP